MYIMCTSISFKSFLRRCSVYSSVTALPLRRHSRAYAEPFCTLTQCHRNGQGRLAQFTEGSSWCSAELGGFKRMFPGWYIVVLCSVYLLVISSAAYIADCLSGFSVVFRDLLCVCLRYRLPRRYGVAFKPSARRFALRHFSSNGDFVQYFRLFVLSAGWLYTAAGKAIRQRGFLPRRLPFDR